MAAPRDRRPAVLAVVAAVAGAVAALVLGLLTFGVQATVHPHDLPLAVAVADDAPPQLKGVAGQLAATPSDEVEWHLTTPEGARAELGDDKVYGVLELAAGKATVVLSGAVNPSGTQVAQQVLGGVVQGLGLKAEVVTLNPASTAGRAAPLAASALLWIAGLVAGMLAAVLVERPGRGSRLLGALTASVLGVGVVVGLLRLWDSSLPLDAGTLGFLLLVAAAFALVQAGLLRLLGVRAMAVLGPLYLMAPAVAGQVPELLDPTYRALLWSWTPFRFSTETLRDLFQGGTANTTALLVFGGMALVGLVVVLLPGQEAEPHPADGVVDVGVHQADRLPGAEHQHTA
ncbi:ABC transporter permease [Umezawaea sp. Da 62-37]|uniref:ABC transporter permease n=1 Tax=Umezawaea sp. Da 62-37 TaxID=3075927 RepID=UPI0028F726CF|nr:ABC transporter permease [Umezawaea sp. Da 62-37]WNV89798.1 ABC transporter permease [Umezawaea sp. Da 62-37]